MFQNIDTLNLPRSKVEEIKRLGYNYCKDLRANSEIKFKDDWDSLIKAPEDKSALDHYEAELLNGCLLSYNEKFDEILQDVVRMKTVTELTGYSGAGKTQICFQLSISVQLPKWCGGLEGEAVYISTNKNFSSPRVREMARNFLNQYEFLKSKMNKVNDNFNEDFIMKHIHYIDIDTPMELAKCLVHLGDYIDKKHVKLIVIDSISLPLKGLDLKQRLAFINKLFQCLRELSSKFNLAVVLTNELTTRADADKAVITPSLGDTFYHLVNSRIFLSRSNGRGFQAKLLKSLVHDQRQVNFYL